MKGRNGKRIATLSFVLIIILIHLISPTLTEFANGQTDDQIKASFDPRPNEPPVAPVNPDPANGTVDVKVPVTLCVDVYDETGYTVDVYFYNASNDTLIGIDYNVPSDWSTASVVWNEPIKGRICYWYAIAKDHEFENKSETWIFATRPNQPSIIHNNEYPQNTSTNVRINVTCNIEISDEDADLMTIYWYENSTGSWVERQRNSSVGNGTYYWTFLQTTTYNTTYWWKVAVNDSINNATAIFHFTTVENQPLTLSNPIPANQSQDVSIATPYWYITINDPENDTVNWTIETYPDIGNASGNDEIIGQKACPLSGMQYNTTYFVYVNATDAGNGSWVNESYWFKSAEEGAPTIANEYPPNRNTQTERQPVCHVDVFDIEGDNLRVVWYEKSTGSWVERQNNSNITANSTVYWTYSQASSYSTTYWWRVMVDDGTYNTTATFNFTVEEEPESPPPPSPGGGSYTPPPNKHPIANITGPNTGYVNQTLVFYAYYSYDPDGYITGYRWDFKNDGVYDTDWLDDLIITCNYSSSGNYTVRLQVMDDDDAVTTSNPHNISIIQLESSLQLPIPKINGPYNGYTNENISFSSNGSYDSDGTIINYTWDFGDGNNSYLEDPVHSYAEPKNYTVILTVTDNDNLSNTTITKAIIIDKEIEEPEEKELPLMCLPILLIIIIATILVLILLHRESDKNKYKTAEAEVETPLSELMKIMYSKDVDAEFVTDKLGISSNELRSLVDELVKRGLLRYTTDDEAELTEQGIKYIESK